MDRAGQSGRPTRIDLRKPGVIVDSEGRTIEVVILDVSSGGFRAQVNEELQVGEFVRLRADRDEFSAQIRWALGGEVGGVFLSPAAPS